MSKNKYPPGQSVKLAKVNLVFYFGLHKVGFWPSYKGYSRFSLQQIVAKMEESIIRGGKQKTPWTVAVFFNNIPVPQGKSQPILKSIKRKDL